MSLLLEIFFQSTKILLALLLCLLISDVGTLLQEVIVELQQTNMLLKDMLEILS